MKKKLKKKLEKKTISLEEFLQDTSPEEKKLIEAEIRYYDMLLALRKLRKQLGLTQSQLAQKAGLPRTTITKIESGAYNPTVQTLVTIASAMDKKLKIEFV